MGIMDIYPIISYILRHSSLYFCLHFQMDLVKFTVCFSDEYHKRLMTIHRFYSNLNFSPWQTLYAVLLTASVILLCLPLNQLYVDHLGRSVFMHAIFFSSPWTLDKQGSLIHLNKFFVQVTFVINVQAVL